jgi:hypothetical protein
MAQRRKVENVGPKGRADMADLQGPPTLTAMGDMTGQFLQGDFASVKGGPTGGSQHAGAPDSDSGGGSVPAAARTPLRGHIQQPALQARGRSAKRGSGQKTRDAKTMIRKVMD